MAKSIHNIRYGGFEPSKILFGNGTECKRVYVGGVMMWNKDDFALSINPSSIEALSTQETYTISVTSTNNEGSIQVPFSATSNVSWAKPLDGGVSVLVEADNEPRNGATDKIEISGNAYITNAGGTLELPEITCVWSNQIPRSGKITYKQGEGSELEAVLELSQKCGSGNGVYELKPKVNWIHVGVNNEITVDELSGQTAERYGEISVISTLSGDTKTFLVHQSNQLVQKREFGIFSKLADNELTIPCTETSGDANIVIRYRYYQVVEDTNERVVGSETSWTEISTKSWTASSSTKFIVNANTSTVFCENNKHNLSIKRDILTFTLKPIDDVIPSNEIASDFSTISVKITQEEDAYVKNGQIFDEYKIADGSNIPVIDAAGSTVRANIISQYRRYKIWKSDNEKEYFNGESWLTDIGATFVSQSISGYVFNFNGLSVSSYPNDSTSETNEGFGRFISNRIVNGQPLYVDLTITQTYREKTAEYRLIDPELTVNGKSFETWNATASKQSKDFPIVSKVLRQYKWTNGRWYDETPNVKMDWDCDVTSISWCTATINNQSKTVNLSLDLNSNTEVREFVAVITQKSDTHFAVTPASATITVNQRKTEPVVPIVPPGSEPFVPVPSESRLKDCKISVTPTTYSVDAAKHSKNDFIVNSTAIVEYLYTDGKWYAQPSRYKIGYSAESSESEWCVASAQDSEGKATIEITSVNDKTQRTAIVTLRQLYANYDESAEKTATINVSQAAPQPIESEVKWENGYISATLPTYQFGSEGGSAVFTVVATADKWCKYTDGEYRLVQEGITLNSFTSSPKSGPIRTDGSKTLTVDPYTGSDELSQVITFTLEDEKGNILATYDTPAIKQAGESPIIPENFDYRNPILTVSPQVWNIDAAEHTSSDFSYVSTVEKWQEWTSGWKYVNTLEVPVVIDEDAKVGDITIKKAENGVITLNANPNHTFSPIEKSLWISQDNTGMQFVALNDAITVTQEAAKIVTPENSKIKEDSYVFDVTPQTLSWQQTITDTQSVTVESYGCRVYEYTDGVWRGKTNKTETGDREDVEYSVSNSTHWTINNKTQFTPKSTADKDYDETVTYTQNSSLQTKAVSLLHKKAEKVSPEVSQRYDYSIEFTSPSNPLNIDTCKNIDTPYSVVSKCKVKCLYNDGNYYYDRDEDVPYIMSTDGSDTNIVINDDKIKTSNLHNETEVRANVFATQNTSSADKATLSVVIRADEKSDTQYEYKIASVSVPSIPYNGTSVTADVVCQMKSYRFWKSDNMKIEETSWSTDSDAVISSQFVSGDSNIQSDGRLTFSATPNTGSLERKATFKFATNRGSEFNSVEVTQVTNIYTKYDLVVTPEDYTFTTPSNGNVTLNVTCRYCVCNGGVDGEWKTCDYTAVPNGVTFDKSTSVATMASNAHNTTALSGSVVFTANDMSSVTGYAGTPASLTAQISGCADELVNASEYRITSASIPEIEVDGTTVTATVNCQQQDYKYWKSDNSRYETTKSWYAITTPSGVTSSKTEGDNAFTGNGLSISATSNTGTTTTNTLYKLTVSGGNQNIAYNATTTSSLVVTQEKKIGNGRNSTTKRNAKFTFTVPFPTGNKTSNAISVSQKADDGSVIIYPDFWSKDVNKSHQIYSSGTNFITLGEPTTSNGVWTYGVSFTSNEGEGFTGTDYRVRFNPESLNMLANETSKTITAIHEKMDIVGGRKSTSERSETFKVTYETEEGSALYKQVGDSGSSGSATGTWLTDQLATLTSVGVSEGFNVTNNGNIITVTTSSNEAKANAPTEIERKVTNTKYSNHNITISDNDGNIAWSGGSSSSIVTATRTEIDVIEKTYETTYKSTSEKSGTITVTTNRDKDSSTTVRQRGDSKSAIYNTETYDDTPRTLQPYIPTLAWSSGYPKGTGASAGIAPSIIADSNENKKEETLGWDRTITFDKAALLFPVEGGTETLTPTLTKKRIYHFVKGESRTLEGKCYDIDNPTAVSEVFTVIQDGQPGDAEGVTHTSEISETDKENKANIAIANNQFSVLQKTDNNGNVYFEVTAKSNQNISEETLYGLEVVSDGTQIPSAMYVGDTVTPDIKVKEQTNTVYAKTNPFTNIQIQVTSDLISTLPTAMTVSQDADIAHIVNGEVIDSSEEYMLTTSNSQIVKSDSNNYKTYEALKAGECQIGVRIPKEVKPISDTLPISLSQTVTVTIRITGDIWYENHSLCSNGNIMNVSDDGTTVSTEYGKLSPDGKTWIADGK